MIFYSFIKKLSHYLLILNLSSLSINQCIKEELVPFPQTRLQALFKLIVIIPICYVHDESHSCNPSFIGLRKRLKMI